MEQENKMGTAPVGALLLKMSLPIILSTAVQSLYNIVDGIFVSQISEEAMTAITLATPVTIALMAVGTGIAVGMNTMLSHALGEKKHDEVNHAAQVALRWNTQRGVVIIPKSSNPDRMAQNLDIWDFSLTEDEMKVISAKDLGHSEIINHFDPEVVKMILGMKIHQ